MTTEQEKASLERDRELIELVQKSRSPEAFGELYDKYYQSIFRYLLYRTGDEDLAKDLTSETFFQALKSMWRFTWQNKPFAAWLYRIAHNQLLVYLKKSKRYCPLTSQESPDILANADERPDVYLVEQEDISERLSQYKKLRTYLKQLPDRQHSIIILRYFANKSIREIAEIFRIPEGTVKSHIHRSLRKLESMFHEIDEKKPLELEEKNIKSLVEAKAEVSHE